VAGTIADRTADLVVVELNEAWVHCAKCVLRSGLWRSNGSPVSESPSANLTLDAAGPLASAPVLAFLQGSPFTFISSWDARGGSDTSPRGDKPGFMQVLDSATLAMPDRKGNKRTDTFHNLMECDEVSLAALIPRSDRVLHLHGTGSVTNDADLLASMALGEKPPHAALVVEVSAAVMRQNSGVRDSQMWDGSSHVDQSSVPDLMALGARHLAMSKEKGAKAAVARTLGKGLAAAPRFLRRGVDQGYRKELEEEGF
jgi:predicted pyridoxine 5'-phosphate oxidase superfamily flavin-nucleotide-binding protein